MTLARCFGVKNPTSGRIVDVGHTRKEARRNAEESSMLGSRTRSMPIVRLVEVPRKPRAKNARRR